MHAKDIRSTLHTTLARLEWLLRKAVKAGIGRYSQPVAFVSPYLTYAAERMAKTDEAIEAALLNALGNDERTHHFSEAYFCSPVGRTRLSPRTLMMWLLHRADERSPSVAVADLERYISRGENPGIAVLALTGIAVDRPLNLGNGVALIPFDALPDCLPKRGLRDRPLGMVLQHEVAITGALVTRMVARPHVLDNAEGPLQENYRAQHLASICQWLTLVGPSCPKIAAQWWQADETVPFRDVSSHWSGVLTDVGHGKARIFTESDRLQAPYVCALLRRTPAPLEAWLRVPIERLNQAMRRHSTIDRAIDLGISLEALLLDDGEQDELSFRLRLRGAWLLGKDKNDRQALMRTLAAVYDCRSKAVHGKQLGPTLKGRPVDQLLLEGCEIAARLMVKIAEGGRPEWQSLVLGSNERP